MIESQQQSLTSYSFLEALRKKDKEKGINEKMIRQSKFLPKKTKYKDEDDDDSSNSDDKPDKEDT